VLASGGLTNLFTVLSADQIILGLVVACGLMVVVEERRLSLAALLAQYLLLGLLVGPELYRPIVLVRIGLGVAVCLVLSITAWHVERVLRHQAASAALPSVWPGSPVPMEHTDTQAAVAHASPTRSMGTLFRCMVLLLAILVAYGLWRTYPLAMIAAAVGLTSYLLVTTGLLVTLTSADPLRMGLGILTFINGFEGAYLFLENSLVMLALLIVVDIIMALGIVACAEMWLAAREGETAL
jgi:hypothetical protein